MAVEFICELDDADESEELDEQADMPTTVAAARAITAADLDWIFLMR